MRRGGIVLAAVATVASAALFLGLVLVGQQLMCMARDDVLVYCEDW